MCIKYYDGRRIYLRPIELADEPLLRQWVNDPANWRTLARFQPVNEQREREFIEGLYKSQRETAFGIVERQSDRLIGIAGLSRISAANRSATFGLIIGERASQSRGFGTEVTRLIVRYGFEELNLNRIDLTVYATHERGIRAYCRAGFREEGRLRQAFYRSGRYHDVLCFAILRGDWEPERMGREPESADQESQPVTQLASMTVWDTTMEA